MEPIRTPIDEHTLAAFLTGTLSEAQRREVTAYLIEHDDARELLCMAQEALEAAEQPVHQPFALPVDPPGSDTPVTEFAVSRRARLSPARSLRTWHSVAATVLLLIVLAVGTRVALNLRDDGTLLRSDDASANLVVHVSMPDLEFQWDRVSDAYYYKIVVFDVQDAAVISQHETRETHLDHDDAFVVALRPQLENGRRYSVRVDAISTENRLIKSSEMQMFAFGLRE